MDKIHEMFIDLRLYKDKCAKKQIVIYTMN
jgi:hypothetical protein